MFSRTCRHARRIAVRGVHTHKFAAPFLRPCAANYEALTPLSLLERSDRLFPDRPAVVFTTDNGRHVRRNWAETARRARRLASGLRRLGVASADTVSIMAPNTPAMVEAHFGVVGSAAVLHTVNIRLDAAAVAFQLEHAESKVALVDSESLPLVRDALAEIEPRHWPILIEINDDEPEIGGGGGDAGGGSAAAGSGDGGGVVMTYEELLASGDGDAPLLRPADENDAIALSYTSGTTGNPKGVVTSHRGAVLNALANCMQTPLPQKAVWLWVVPLFHCNGWCYPWSVAAVGGTNVCLRHVRAAAMLRLMADEGVTHTGGAPVAMNMLLQAPEKEKSRFHATRAAKGLSGEITMVTAGAPPPPSVMRSLLAQLDIRSGSAYGLTEVFGPVTTLLWEDHWGPPPRGREAETATAAADEVAATVDDAAAAAAGSAGAQESAAATGASAGPEGTGKENDHCLTWQAHSPMMGDMVVEAPRRKGAAQAAASAAAAAAGPAPAPTMETVPMDGVATGEVLFRGNTVMLGYLKNEQATLEAFEGGWFHTGDMAVWHQGGRVELKDRSKDVIISGGENISSIEVESALHRHPAVSAAAVVAVEDPFWGEAPCAVVELVPGSEGEGTVSAEELISHCRTHLAPYKCPKVVVFEELPKTSTGKIQKFQLRKSLAKRGIKGPGKPGKGPPTEAAAP